MAKWAELMEAAPVSEVGACEGESARVLELARMAKALGHPMRVRILRYLAGRDSCMCGDLVQVLPVAQSTVSQHLKILKEAGLIQGTIDPPRVCYCVNPKALATLRDLVDWAATIPPRGSDADVEPAGS